jgi:sec-independent protein translocase protein TatC
MDYEGTIWDHLKDLRRLVLKVSIVLFIGFLICLVFNQQLINFYLGPLNQASGANIPPHTNPLGPMLFRMQVAAVTAFIVCFPINLIFLWQYISPILRERERKFLGPYILSFLVLASVGLVYAYFLLLPQSLQILISYVPEGTTILITVDEYMRFVTMIFLATVLAFQTPIAIFTLLIFRLLPKNFFDDKRREVYFALIVFLAAITPTGDLITLAMIFLPMAILYEGTVLLAKLLLRNVKDEEEPNSDDAQSAIDRDYDLVNKDQ